ncbi:MAG: hypothetical protein A3J97_00755 [Spirochaetes bacterium RIFOXYC1_FULL_54_7]|nr:MAG: hypothetical protein A3J97_00755 [Spirochaetes bacterium RIFOXYC1_FULL_54_7]
MISANQRIQTGDPVTVREWDTILAQDLGNPRAFHELHDWALSDEGRRVLEAGLGKIRVLNHAGVIMTKSGFVLEVLPKTEDGADYESSRKILLNMLSRSGMLPSFGGGSAPTDIAALPLNEGLVELFLDALVSLVKRGLSSIYIAQEEHLPCIRGRIDFSEFARKNRQRSMVPCRFD